MTPDPSEEPDSDQGVFGPLRRLLEAIAEIEDDGDTRREFGRIDRRSATIDYRYDVTIGLGHDDPTKRRGGPSDRRTLRIPTEYGDHEHRVEVRETRNDHERVVVADLPGVPADAVDVAHDEESGVLELVADDEVVESVPLEWASTTITDVRSNNGILEVHLRPTTGDTDD